MSQKIVMETVDTTLDKSASIELCKGDIPHTRVWHHIVATGDTLTIPANTGCYHILVLVAGDVDFQTDGKTYRYNERVTFVPAPDKELVIISNSNVNIVEIQWDWSEQDTEMIAEYDTVFPVAQTYKDAIQYTDPNKSEKTISRMMIPHRVIPRFAIGSVETYGHDYVNEHAHPMLDQFFFSFPENDMNVLIDGEKIPMKGNQVFHIPLGSNHGVDIPEGHHCHYMWIDFLPDNEKGLQRLDQSHKVLNTMRSFDEEEK